MRSIRSLENIENKNVILRVDLNVPIINGKITDTNRIDKIIPTLNFLIKKKSKNNHCISCWKTQWQNSKRTFTCTNIIVYKKQDKKRSLFTKRRYF